MRSDSRLWKSVLLTALFAGMLVPVSGCRAGSRGTPDAEEAFRYNVTRTRQLIVRIDSANGQVWLVPANGDGGWWALGGPPSDAGRPNEFGRYRVSLVLGPRGTTLGERSSSLLRLDLATGRAWLAEAALGAEWTAIPEPNQVTARP